MERKLMMTRAADLKICQAMMSILVRVLRMKLSTLKYLEIF